MIIVFTGEGKGKTTAAIGTGIRAVGSGKKVLMIQFMKVKERSSESKVLESIDGFDIYSFGREGFFLPDEELRKNPELIDKGFKPFSYIDFHLAEEGISFVEKNAENYELIILDEVCVAVHYKLLDIKRVLDLLDRFREKIFILTGRYCDEKIIYLSDLVTEMREIKHYFRKGVKAVKGIDF